MGGKTTVKERSTQDNTIDPFTKRLIEQGRSNIRDIQADNPFQGYDKDRVAGLSDLEGRARDSFLSTMGEGTGLMGMAADAAMQAGGYQPERVTADSFAGANLDPYLNPYQDKVIDANARRIDRERDTALARQRDDALASGAWGGSRSGIQQSETARNFDDRKTDMSARLMAENFREARDAFGADANRSLTADTTNASLGLQGAGLRLQGAGLLGELGQGIGEANRAEAGFLGMLGANERNITDRQLGADYDEFMREQNFARQLISEELSMMGLTPTIVDSRGTSTSTQSSTPGFGQLLGLGLQAAPMIFSDERTKTDVVRVGERNGLGWYRYRHHDDAPGTVREGVMASEVEAKRPDAVSVDAQTGFKTVDYTKLGLEA